MLAITVALLAAATAAGPAKVGTGTPQQVVLQPHATSISSLTVAAATLNFALTSPNSPAVANASTVSWKTAGGAAARSWTLAVASPAASFTGCAEVPPAAVTVTCGSVTGGTGGACGGTITLTTANQTIATGNEGTGNTNYSVSLTISIADSWTYKGHTAACTLAPQYTLTAN